MSMGVIITIFINNQHLASLLLFSWLQNTKVHTVFHCSHVCMLAIEPVWCLFNYENRSNHHCHYHHQNRYHLSSFIIVIIAPSSSSPSSSLPVVIIHHYNEISTNSPVMVLALTVLVVEAQVSPPSLKTSVASPPQQVFSPSQ